MFARRFSSATALLAMLACTDQPRADQDTPSPDTAAGRATLGPDGYGQIRIGSTLAQLNAALGQHLEPKYEINDSCDFVRPLGLPGGMSVMIESDTVVRIDVDSAGVRTAEGAGVGDDEARVVALYAGRVAVMPHHYTGPEGHYLVVTFPDDTASQVIFETDGRRVLELRAGRRSAVELAEGCA